MHIGLIGGIGPSATEFYYRGPCDAFDATNKVMNLTIVHVDNHEIVRNATVGDPKNLFVESSNIREASAGGCSNGALEPRSKTARRT